MWFALQVLGWFAREKKKEIRPNYFTFGGRSMLAREGSFRSLGTNLPTVERRVSFTPSHEAHEAGTKKRHSFSSLRLLRVLCGLV
ncbi:MAG: hypothetical protein ABL996_16040 [Micropepsaceae bacterium]